MPRFACVAVLMPWMPEVFTAPIAEARRAEGDARANARPGPRGGHGGTREPDLVHWRRAMQKVREEARNLAVRSHA